MRDTRHHFRRSFAEHVDRHTVLRLAILTVWLASVGLGKVCFAQAPDVFEGVKAVHHQTETGVSYCLYQDVIYQGAEGERLADVYIPATVPESPRGALLLIHGGGWAAGDKGSGRQVEMARFALEEGLVAVSINYSLTKFAGGNPRGNKLRAGWPSNIYDCKSALRWLKTHSKTLLVDPQRIGAVGGSAGGHLALLLGLSAQSPQLNAAGAYLDQDNKVRCIIDFYGIPDVRKFEVYSLLSERDRYDQDIQSLASPVEHLTKDSPPVLILHGTEDRDVEPALSEFFVARAKELGARCQYVPVEDAGHGFGLKPNGRDLRPLVKAFLAKHL